jgi:hypothetical protein
MISLSQQVPSGKTNHIQYIVTTMYLNIYQIKFYKIMSHSCKGTLLLSVQLSHGKAHETDEGSGWEEKREG